MSVPEDVIWQRPKSPSGLPIIAPVHGDIVQSINFYPSCFDCSKVEKYRISATVKCTIRIGWENLARCRISKSARDRDRQLTVASCLKTLLFSPSWCWSWIVFFGDSFWIPLILSDNWIERKNTLIIKWRIMFNE